MSVNAGVKGGGWERAGRGCKSGMDARTEEAMAVIGKMKEEKQYGYTLHALHSIEEEK